MYLKLSIILIVVCMCTLSVASPIFGLFGSRSGGQSSYQGRSYNDIARVLNPSPYAFPRSSPFPAQPFWTYTG